MVTAIWSIEQAPSISAMGVTKHHRGKMMREGQVNSGLLRLCNNSSNVIRTARIGAMGLMQMVHVGIIPDCAECPTLSNF